MNLTFLFDWEAAGNPYFKYIYHSIFNNFKELYPQHSVKHSQPLGYYQSGPGGMSNFQIINDDNNKTIVMSFWDRGMDVFQMGLGWEQYNIVQYIGGLGLNLNSKQIKEIYNINHVPYQYPLGVPKSYDYVDEFRTDYDPTKKIRKAVFIGAVYGIRKKLEVFFKNHPLIDWFDSNAGIGGRDYYEKLKNYRIALSLNGNGEFCLRDLEAMGLRIPVVRSELLTPFYIPLVPDYHYIKASEPCKDACYIYANISVKDLAEQFIHQIEKNIDNFDTLNYIASNGYDYFDNYSRPDYIINLFFKLANFNSLI
jgi:hypothetical protein